ncbi:hypothetical protein TREES_T100009793 [Tupaia chinensis]|uniref:Uncharacterized protein n=1 Tax=Tupaia chinensis TaxID=246437 RepID=L9KRT5_TUPCH|nr:hypothetical protein TREES_T100009793 [Tupaia chinensis]
MPMAVTTFCHVRSVADPSDSSPGLTVNHSQSSRQSVGGFSLVLNSHDDAMMDDDKGEDGDNEDDGCCDGDDSEDYGVPPRGSMIPAIKLRDRVSDNCGGTFILLEDWDSLTICAANGGCSFR